MKEKEKKKSYQFPDMCVEKIARLAILAGSLNSTYTEEVEEKQNVTGDDGNTYDMWGNEI